LKLAEATINIRRKQQNQARKKECLLLGLLLIRKNYFPTKTSTVYLASGPSGKGPYFTHVYAISEKEAGKENN
jgi:hypothetical protein